MQIPSKELSDVQDDIYLAKAVMGMVESSPKPDYTFTLFDGRTIDARDYLEERENRAVELSKGGYSHLSEPQKEKLREIDRHTLALPDKP